MPGMARRFESAISLQYAPGSTSSQRWPATGKWQGVSTESCPALEAANGSTQQGQTKPCSPMGAPTQRHRMTKVLQAIALWACQLGALYAWEILGIDGAGNVLSAWIAVLLALTVVFFIGVDFKKPYQQPGGLPKWIVRPLNLAFFLALVWFGHGWLATAYGLAVLITMAIHLSWKAEHEKRAGMKPQVVA